MKGRIILGLVFVVSGLLACLVPYFQLRHPIWTPLSQAFDVTQNSGLETDFEINARGVYTVKLQCDRAGALSNAPGRTADWLASPHLPVRMELRILRRGGVVFEEAVTNLRPSTTASDTRHAYFTLTRAELRETGKFQLTVTNRAAVPQVAGANPRLELQYSRAVWRQRTLRSLIGLLAGVLLVLIGLAILVFCWLRESTDYIDFE